TAYLARRFLLIVPVLFGASLVVFFMMHLTPGDSAQAMLGPLASKELLEELRQELGLNKPVYVQYWHWIGRVARSVVGRTIYLKSPVASEDRKSTRLNSSHEWISYAVFCLK